MTARVQAGGVAEARPFPPWAIVGVAAALGIAVLALPPFTVALAFAGTVGLGVVYGRPRLGLLAWFVTTPILGFWARISLPAGVPDLTFDRGFVVVAAVTLALRRLAGHAGPLRLGRVELAMAIYAGLAGLGVLRGSDVTTDLQLLIDAYVTPFLVYVLVRRIAADAPDARPFLFAVGLVGVGLAALGAAQMTLHRIPLVPASFVPIHVGRMTGPFYNAAEFGSVVSIGALAAALLASVERGPLRRAAATVAAAVCVGAAVASLTRAVWLGLVLATCVVAWRHRPSRGALRAVAVTAVVLAALVLPAVVTLDDVLERGAESKPVEIRLVSAMTAARMWIDRPLLGYGFGRWTYYENRGEHYTAFGDISAERGAVVGVPHDEFLHQLVLTGALGLACHVAIWTAALWAGLAACGRRRAEVRALGALLLAAMTIYLVNGLFADLLFFPYLTTTVFLLFGAVRGLLDAPRPQAAP